MHYIITLLLLLPLATYASVIEVCPSCPISTIQQGLDMAQNGDRINIGKGIYKEHQLVIEKSVALIGKKGAIIDGEEKGQILQVEADNVHIKNLEIRNVGVSYTKDRAGIKVETQKNVVIENNRLVNTFFGIYLVHSVSCVIRNNVIIGQAVQEFSAGNAIHIWYSDSILVENNRALKHRDGIYLEFVKACVVNDNYCEGNVRYGMHFMFSDGNQFHRNTFVSNGAGVAIMFSNRITMTHNQFSENWGSSSYGVLLKEIKDSEISNNFFRSNTIGLYAEGSNRNQVHHNIFTQNGWALKIMGNCEDNVFSNNDFFANTFELATNAKRNWNDYSGNYWSEYTGYDLDQDGVGDVPHGPISLFSFVVENNPPTIILLRSFFVDLLNFAEKTTPVLTPANIQDEKPLLRPVN
jgi:nitrous oxidase accessory protein